jgi:hypothetical protein
MTLDQKFFVDEPVKEVEKEKNGNPYRVFMRRFYRRPPNWKEDKYKNRRPKKHVHAYLWYIADAKGQIYKENPTLEHKEIMKMISERWFNLPIEDKDKYERLSIKDRQRYEEELAVYNEGVKNGTIKPEKKTIS